MNKLIKCKHAANGGFTLVEVIISIAVLSIASVFILQMFMISAQLNRNAYDVDQANMLLSTLAESFFLSENPALFQSDPLLNGAVTIDKTGGKTLAVYYDKKWSPCGPESAQYALTVHLSVEDEGPAVPQSLGAEGGTRGALYSITCEVSAIDAYGTSAPIAQLISNAYFNSPGEVGI